MQQDRTSLLARLAGLQLGVIPLPVYAAIVLIVVTAAMSGTLSKDLIGGLAVMMAGGVALDLLGRKIPVLRNIGGPAILCLFVPAALVGDGLFNPEMLASVQAAMKTDNLLYLYIASLVVGSIFGIDHRVLSKGFLRMCVPFLAGTAVALAVGMAVGEAVGFGAHHTFFFILTPIFGGGIGEGILPLSIGYAAILGTPQPEIVATMIPAAMIGNVVAILLSGSLGWLGEHHPRFSGKGNLVDLGPGAALPPPAAEAAFDVKLKGAGLLLICAMFALGGLLAPVTGISGPVVMIIIVAALKLARIMPARMEQGAYQMYRFIAINLTPAVLVGLGAIYVSWDQLLAALSPAFFAVCASAVLALVATGFVVGRMMGMHPVESAIVTACHSGLGGTGDVAVLSASNRMNLMPFSQIVTRVGGAGMVVAATLLLRHLG